MVVGTLQTASGFAGFLYTAGQGMRLLSDLTMSGWTITQAIDISNTGYIVGRGYNRELGYGETAILLTPD